MISTGFFDRIETKAVVLCLGAHSDDIEIGCGGILRMLTEKCRDLTVHWIVLSAEGARAREARSSAEAILTATQRRTIEIKTFRNGYFPYVATEIKEYFETLKTLPEPDLIFTHCGTDRHQDHRLVSDLTWNTFRNHMILEYEIPKYDGDLQSPNVFVPLHRDELTAKTQHLMTHFESQHDKQWFTSKTFEAICRIRGIECNSPTGFAEAFYGRKIIL